MRYKGLKSVASVDQLRANLEIPRRSPHVGIVFLLAACTLLVASRLVWHLIFKLDRYDWRENKGEIALTFALLHCHLAVPHL